MCDGVAFKMTRSCRTGPEDCDAEVGAFGLRGAEAQIRRSSNDDDGAT